MLTSKFGVIFLVCAMLLGATAMSHAQYVGPTAQKAIESVAEVLKDPKDDQRVVLHGYLLKQVGTKKYIFSDGTGEIRGGN